MPVQSDAVVIMAKYPTPGLVKTRLAHALGAERACALYRAFLLDLASRFAGDRRVVWAVHPPGAALAEIVGPALIIDQVGSRLGDRLLACVRKIFAAGASRTVVIGADTPHLSDGAIAAGFSALAAHDISLVAARDGGYCLIGLRAPHDVFTGIEMGTPRVLRETLDRIAALGLTAALVGETFDVDEPADLEELAAALRSGRVHLPATAAALGLGTPPA